MKTQPMINTQNISNDLLSEYPVLVHNSYVVQKNNIWTYLKKLVVLYKEKSDRFLTGKTMEKLVAGKLHLLTVSSTKQTVLVGQLQQSRIRLIQHRAKALVAILQPLILVSESSLLPTCQDLLGNRFWKRFTGWEWSKDNPRHAGRLPARKFKDVLWPQSDYGWRTKSQLFWNVRARGFSLRSRIKHRTKFVKSWLCCVCIFKGRNHKHSRHTSSQVPQSKLPEADGFFRFHG